MGKMELHCNQCDPAAEKCEAKEVQTLRSNRVSKEPLVASLLLVVRPGAPSSFLLLVAMPGAPSSVLAPSSDARSP